MKRTVTLVAGAAMALGVVAGPATAAPKEPKPNNVAAKLCQGEKQADKAAFKATYGKHAMRDCKRSHRGEAGEAIANASQDCRAERELDAAAFAETYGTNPNGRNAFGKCVSAKSDDEVSEETEEFANAADECRAERNADAEAFTETYGTNRNKRNAFGKCVSQKAQEDDVEPEEPVSA
jgi:hypothetical protein